MTNLIVTLTQIGVVFFWLAVILSLASVIPVPYQAPIVWIGSFVLLVHLSEYFVVRKKLDGRDGMEISFVKTIVFGFTHWLPLVAESRRRGGNL